MKEKILVSACLLGEKCRYDGKSCPVKAVQELMKYYDLIPVCPEVLGGLKTPRYPSEIKDSRVVNSKGFDVTEKYQTGAYWVKTVCQVKNIKLAVLKEKSPSCGCKKIYDGSFSGKLIDGKGITVRELEKIGVKVIDEEDAIELLASKEKEQ